MSRDIYFEVTSRIMAALEAGTVPWHKPWKESGGFPVNIRTGKRYRGINILLLTLQGFADPRWGTYKAIGEAGGQVRKGEKGTHIILWKPVQKKETAEGEGESYLLLRDYVVFNALQADGIEPLQEEVREFTPIEEAERLVSGYAWSEGLDNPGPPVFYGYDHAAYLPTRDHLHMPSPEMFVSDEAFYGTLFHELVHSTGHESRLKRIEPALFGTDPYAREELVAEMGASFLSGIAGFDETLGEQSAAYIAGWLKALENDRKLVVQAAAQAQKAVDLIVGRQPEEEVVQPENTVVHA